MDSILKGVEGYKTYILIAVFIVLVVTGAAQTPEGFDITNIGAADLEKVVLGMVAATAKAAFNRIFGKETLPTPPEAE